MLFKCLVPLVVLFLIKESSARPGLGECFAKSDRFFYIFSFSLSLSHLATIWMFVVSCYLLADIYTLWPCIQWQYNICFVRRSRCIVTVFACGFGIWNLINVDFVRIFKFISDDSQIKWRFAIFSIFYICIHIYIKNLRERWEFSSVTATMRFINMNLQN